MPRHLRLGCKLIIRQALNGGVSFGSSRFPWTWPRRSLVVVDPAIPLRSCRQMGTPASAASEHAAGGSRPLTVSSLLPQAGSRLENRGARRRCRCRGDMGTHSTAFPGRAGLTRLISGYGTSGCPCSCSSVASLLRPVANRPSHRSQIGPPSSCTHS